MSSDAWQPRSGSGAAGPLAPRFARVVLREEELLVTPMAWRQVGPGAAAAPKSANPNTNATATANADANTKANLNEQVERIRQQCEQRVKDAHAAGMREADAAAQARATAGVQVVLEKMARSIEELAQIRTRLRKQAEGDTIKLSLAIARRVLRREIAMDPDAMRGLVTAALEKLQSQEICRVRTHPSQVAAITACLRQTVNNVKVEVVPDGSLQPGGVVFETNQGNLDASVDSQLQEIERGLADHMRKQS